VELVDFAVAREIPTFGDSRLRFSKTIEMQEPFEEGIAETAFELTGYDGGIDRFRFGSIEYHEIGTLVVRTTAGHE
jgi:hypothetical protein